MKGFILGKSNEEFHTSNSELAMVGALINRFLDFKKRINDVSPRSGGISHADVACTYLGLLCIGKGDYDAVTDRREDSYFKTSLGLAVVPSSETLRLWALQAERDSVFRPGLITDEVNSTGRCNTSERRGCDGNWNSGTGRLFRISSNALACLNRSAISCQQNMK